MASDDVDMYPGDDYYIHHSRDVESPAYHQTAYTDKFWFNGRRLRTKKQIEVREKMAAERGNYLMKTGQRTGVSMDLNDLIGQDVVIELNKEAVMAIPITKEQLTENKFYVGSPTVFINHWGHPTVDEAIKHAQSMFQKNKHLTEVSIVEIIRVVKRKPVEVDVETV